MNNWRRDENQVNKGIIVLRMLNKKQQPAKICPLPDRDSGKLYTGQGYLSAAKKEELPLVVDEYTTLTIKDGHRFDLNDEVDAIHWRWARRHPYIELTKELANASPDAIFYIENKEAEAEAKVKREDQIIEAKYLVKKATLSQRKELCEIFQQDPDHMTESEILGYLYDRAIAFPNQVLNYFDPSKKDDVNLDLEVAKLRKAGIIWRAASNTFKFGDPVDPKKAVNLGRTEDKVKEFLLNPDNYDVLEEMRMLLSEKESEQSNEE